MARVDVTWSSDCCIHKIRLRPAKAKLRTIDDLKAEIGEIKQLLTSQLDEVTQHHEPRMAGGP